MSRLEKLYRQALSNPGSVRFSDLHRLLERYGFTPRQAGGGTSHYVYTRGDIQLTVPKHGSDGVKPVYVRRAMAALESLTLTDDEEGDDDDDASTTPRDPDA